MVGERKRKTPEGLSAVDTPPPSLSSALSPTLSHGAPLTKETCSLPAAARALATRRRDALLTILGQDSPPLPRPLSLTLYLFLCRRHASTTGTLEWSVFCDTRILRSLGERTTPSMFLLVSPILSARGVQSRRNARPRGITSAEARRAGNTSVAIILSTDQLIFRLLYSSIRTIFMFYVVLFLD